MMGLFLLCASQAGDLEVKVLYTDRIVHKSHVIQLKGESMRKLKGKKA